MTRKIGGDTNSGDINGWDRSRSISGEQSRFGVPVPPLFSFIRRLHRRQGVPVGGACARCPPREANGRLLLGDVAAARRLQRRTRERSRYFSPTKSFRAPEYLSISPPDCAIPSPAPPLAASFSLLRTPLSSVPVTSGRSQATPPHDERQRHRRLDGDARNGVEES